MSAQPWEEIDHTADWALRVWGEDRRALFENAARGMISLIGGQADPVQTLLVRQFTLTAPDWEMLLIDWLTELLFLTEDEGIILTQITVHRVEDLSIEAEVQGASGAGMEKHIKAATYHNLSILSTDQGYETVIVFDV
jgi:SHS2 domain-containing protein